MLRTLDLVSVPSSSFNSVRIFCQGCKAPYGIGLVIPRGLGQDCSKGQRPEKLSHPKQCSSRGCHSGSQDPCSVPYPGIVGVTSFPGLVMPEKP